MLWANRRVAALRRGTSMVMDMVGSERPAGTPWLAAAVLLTVAGAVVGVVEAFVDLPLWLGLAGLAAFAVGTVTAVWLAFAKARRDGISVVRALGRALKTGFKWLWEFAP